MCVTCCVSHLFDGVIVVLRPVVLALLYALTCQVGLQYLQPVASYFHLSVCQARGILFVPKMVTIYYHTCGKEEVNACCSVDTLCV